VTAAAQLGRCQCLPPRPQTWGGICTGCDQFASPEDSPSPVPPFAGASNAAPTGEAMSGCLFQANEATEASRATYAPHEGTSPKPDVTAGETARLQVAQQQSMAVSPDFAPAPGAERIRLPVPIDPQGLTRARLARRTEATAPSATVLPSTAREYGARGDGGERPASSMVRELEAEGARLDRTIQWLLMRAWVLARREIRRMGAPPPPPEARP
jgi:hypothetical protein